MVLNDVVGPCTSVFTLTSASLGGRVGCVVEGDDVQGNMSVILDPNVTVVVVSIASKNTVVVI